MYKLFILCTINLVQSEYIVDHHVCDLITILFLCLLICQLTGAIFNLFNGVCSMSAYCVNNVISVLNYLFIGIHFAMYLDLSWNEAVLSYY